MSPQPHHAADNNNDAKKVSDMINIRSSEYCLVNPIFTDYGFYEDPCFLLKQKLFLKDRFTEKNSLKIPSFPAKVKWLNDNNSLLNLRERKSFLLQLQNIPKLKIKFLEKIIRIFIFSFHLRTRKQARSDGNLQMHLKSERRGSRSSDHPLDPSFFGEKISLKRRKTRQSERITFSSRGQLFFRFVLFSLSLIIPNMVDPGNFMIWHHQRRFALRWRERIC